jgi:hypothetical protein
LAALVIGQSFRTNSGSLAIFAATRRASSFVSVWPPIVAHGTKYNGQLGHSAALNSLHVELRNDPKGHFVLGN